MSKVKFASQTTIGEAAIFAALDNGYFREQGLDVELVPFQDTSQMIPALVTGQLDFGPSAVFPGLFNATERSLNVKIVAYLTILRPTSLSVGIVMRQDHIDSGRFKDAKDLKGMTVAIPPGGMTLFFLDKLTTSAGISLTDVNTTSMPLTQMPLALANKAVDAAMGVEPFITIAEQQHSAKLVLPSGAFAPGVPNFVLQMSPIFASQQPQVADRAMLAILKGTRDNYNAFRPGGNPETMIKVLQNHLATKDADLLTRMSTSTVPPDGLLDPKPLDEVQDAFVRHGLIKQKVDINQVVDSSYLGRAAKQLTN